MSVRLVASTIAALTITAAACAQTPADTNALAPAPAAAVDRATSTQPDTVPAFTRLDADRDGRITKAEWTTAGRRERGFAIVDVDKNSEISLEEMRSSIQDRVARRGPAAPSAMASETPAARPDPARAFARIDLDKNGKVSRTEWTSAGRQERAFGVLDANKDAEITLDEMRARVRAGSARSEE